MSRVAFVGLLLVGICWPTKAADPVKLPKELAIVPADALAMASLQVKTIMEHSALKGTRDWIVNSALEREFKEVIGVKFDDIERFTVVLVP